MTHMFKALIIAAIGATTFTAQVSTVYAMGSDRDPTKTMRYEPTASQQRFVAQKNKVFIRANTGSPVNEYFLAQK